MRRETTRGGPEGPPRVRRSSELADYHWVPEGAAGLQPASPAVEHVRVILPVLSRVTANVWLAFFDNAVTRYEAAAAAVTDPWPWPAPHSRPVLPRAAEVLHWSYFSVSAKHDSTCETRLRALDLA